jgi:hypothetical protein
MGILSEVGTEKLGALDASLRSAVSGCASLDVAAQRAADVLFEAFQASLALVRIYATVPYGRLPASIQTFVDRLAEAKQIRSAVKSDTPVLSLVGTRGVVSEWNDRRKSVGHVGIPLASSAFVESIPMVASLLNELGLGLKWVDTNAPGSVRSAAATATGVFFVADAATAVDSQGRKIIPAQDFVASFGVRSVFGVGAPFVDGTLAVMLLFTRETLDRAHAEPFVRLMKSFKLMATRVAVVNKQLFQ